MNVEVLTANEICLISFKKWKQNNFIVTLEIKCLLIAENMVRTQVVTLGYHAECRFQHLISVLHKILGISNKFT